MLFEIRQFKGLCIHEQQYPATVTTNETNIATSMVAIVKTLSIQNRAIILSWCIVLNNGVLSLVMQHVRLMLDWKSPFIYKYGIL